MSRRGADAPHEAGEHPIRVLLVDDHAVVRKGLRALLDREVGIEVAGEAEDGEQALRAVDRLRPDVILSSIGRHGRDRQPRATRSPSVSWRCCG
jgi:DNA-binding NarL/FixJ family response regulator